MRNEVVAGLKLHAVGKTNALRSSVLAKKIGLPRRVVSNALNWLVMNEQHPEVKREKEPRVTWYRYWWTGGAD